MIRLSFLFLLLVLVSCGTIDDKPFYIKTVKINNQTRLNWYFYSLITDYSVDKVEIQSNGKRTEIFDAPILTDISFRNDTLVFQLEHLSYRDGHTFSFIDTAYIQSLGYKYLIDTTGVFLNEKYQRLQRLKNMDISKPHYINTDYISQEQE
jgi:hypothetical protein